MNILAAAAGLVAVAACSALGGPSLSSAVLPPESRFTALTGDTCRPAAHGPDRERQTYCPGLGGARVLLSDGPAGTGVGFAWSSAEVARDVLQSRDVGSVVEWRGNPTSKGFEPYAAIIRASASLDAASDDRGIAVLRVRPGEVCLVGRVDVAPNVDAEHLARLLADERARSATCAGRDH